MESISNEVYNKTLIDIEDRIATLGGNELSTYGLPQTFRSGSNSLPTAVIRETSYDIQALSEVRQREGRIFFLDALGGTGKTFITKLLFAQVRQHQDIAVAVASSGIAATLLPSGRTAHSTFKFPLNLVASDMPSCNITKSSDQGQVLQMCHLIVWDECTMAHKRALETLDRALKDIRDCHAPMRGVTLLLLGDFGQTLPVIPKGTRADEVQACLQTSTLWHHVTILSLNTNMRAQLHGDQMSKKFAQDILTIGDDDLKYKVFPNFKENYLNHNWLCERAILAPKNLAVTKINQQLMHSLPGNLQTYKSVDTVPDTNEVANYPLEFLNSLEHPGLPSHILSLKVGAPVMLLRNLEPPRLCNGTRLVIKKMMSHVIEATILSGCGKGDDVFIPRIPLTPSGGQTLSVAGLLLEEPCFSHGQLYVGCSRVGSKTNLFAYAPQGKTRNIVYNEVL
uniref:ATP-dependent DNA helicase n=1 Tax=Octopus bimaculoides TaxID=37653 RepID=A0A0L8IDV1_OCTBM